jgi:sugar phosphate isomerase/epimerase
MLARGGRWAAAGALGLGFADPFLEELAAAKDRRFKIGVCDWTIQKRADPAAFDMAKRIGLDGVQVDLGHQDRGLPVRNPELQKQYLETTKRTGVAIASLAIGALNDVPYRSDPRAEQWVSDSIDVAKALGVKVVLVPFFSQGDLRGDDLGKKTVVERFKKVAPKAEREGVILGIESWLSADEHVDIIERVGSRAVQVYYDVGNSNRAGYDIYREIRKLGKLICEFHAKDYVDIFGRGNINFREIRKAMDEIGFNGWIQIESAKMPLGLEATIASDLKHLRKHFTARA